MRPWRPSRAACSMWVESVLPHFLLDKTYAETARRGGHEARHVAAAARPAQSEGPLGRAGGWLHRHRRHRPLPLRYIAEAAGQGRVHANPQRHSGHRGAREPAVHLRRQARHIWTCIASSTPPARARRSSSACFRAREPSPWAATPIWSIYDPHYAARVSAETQHVNSDYNGFEGMAIEGRPSVVTVRGKVQVSDGEFVGETRARAVAEARAHCITMKRDHAPLIRKRTIAELKELRALPPTTNGAQRRGLDRYVAQGARVVRLPNCAACRSKHHYDAAGNRWVTLPASRSKALLIGSHLDSVPNGGWLDGCLGCWPRSKILRRIARGVSTDVRRSPFVWSIGRTKKARDSAAACSGPRPSPARTRIEADRGRTDQRRHAPGRRAAPLRRRDRPLPRSAARAEERRRLSRIAHRAGPGARSAWACRWAWCSGTKGVERHAITFHGQEAHSGSTPMNARRDALAAAAKLALEIRPIAGKHPDAVCTMGSVKTFPGIVTAVVGRCEATLDQRDLDADVLAAMYDREARRGQRALRRRRRLHRGMVAHLEHRADAVPSAP